MDKAALYLRLSKEDADKLNRGDDSKSIINQRILLTDYALEKGMQVVDVYADDDYSGLYDDRPEFDRLICDGKLGKFNVVIAKSQSRFTRNMEHMEKYLHHDFPLMGIRFIGVVDGVDTQVKENKKARQIYGLTNEWYCEDLSENIRSVFKQKMKDGQFLGSFAPYGYIKDPADHHKFLIDEEAADVVRQIFSWYLEGYSVYQICHLLEEKNIPSPTVYKQQCGLTYANAKAEAFSIKYSLWSMTTINRILRNETYIGTLIQGTCTKVSYKDKKVVSVPKERWITVKEHHAAIIQEDVFYRVQKLKERRRVAGKNQSGDRKIHIFAGKLRCSACSSTMIKVGPVRGMPQDRYLRCQLANKSRNQKCTSHSIRYSVIEETVLSGIQSIVNPILCKNNEELKSVLWTVNKDTKRKIEMEKEIKDLQKTLEKTREAIGLIYMDRAKGLITETQFFDLKKNMDKKIEEMEVSLYSRKETWRQWKENNVKSDDLLKKYCDYTKLTHEMVADFIDYIEVHEKDENGKQELTIHWNI